MTQQPQVIRGTTSAHVALLKQPTCGGSESISWATRGRDAATCLPEVIMCDTGASGDFTPRSCWVLWEWIHGNDRQDVRSHQSRRRLNPVYLGYVVISFHKIQTQLLSIIAYLLWSPYYSLNLKNEVTLIISIMSKLKYVQTFKGLRNL